MAQEPKHFTVVDPRTFEGDPFEVADRAVAQAQAVARVLVGCTETASIMARNAEMERNLMASAEAGASEWDDSLYGKRWNALKEALRRVEKELGTLGKAAAFNPKKAR